MTDNQFNTIVDLFERLIAIDTECLEICKEARQHNLEFAEEQRAYRKSQDSRRTLDLETAIQHASANVDKLIETVAMLAATTK